MSQAFIDMKIAAIGAAKRVESLWCNRVQGRLF
jgi:hypothetical protein